MKARFSFPTRILFGPEVSNQLPEELQQLGAQKPLLVTDHGLMATELPKRFMDLLLQKGLRPALFSDVLPNPDDAQIEAGAMAFRKHRADSVVALGGGSPIDAAKAIQLRIHHQEPLQEYDDLKGGDAKIVEPLPPLVAIPTTAGTGSEVSRSAVITVKAVGRKVVLFSPRLIPTLALCDPTLTLGLPPKITAETGMDALSHNLEAYLASGYHPMADAIALRAIDMIVQNLPIATQDGQNLFARQEMLMASCMGAVAFQKGLGVVHSLAHPLSTVAGLGHGLANAILLPHAIRFNGPSLGDRLKPLAQALGSPSPTVEAIAEQVSALTQTLKLPQKLSLVGVRPEQIESIVHKAMEDGCHQTNPRACQPADMEAILRTAM